MQKQNKNIKAKVTVGYLLLIAVLFFSVYFVYREMTLLSGSDDNETEMTMKRKVTNATLAKLYEAEVIGQSLSAGRLSDYPAYKKAMREVQSTLDSLKGFVADSFQLARIDSVSTLLDQKQWNMLSLLKILKEAKSDTLYQQNIAKVIMEQDSVVKQERVKRKVVVKQNSYAVVKRKKGFFKRIGEVFSPSRDTATITNTSHEMLTDTLMQEYNPADTVAGILKNIKIQITNKQQEVQEMLDKRTYALKISGQVLTTKINRIIRDFEEDEMSRSLMKIEREQDIKRSSMRTIAGIAIGAVFLSAIFLILIWRDITKSNHYRRQLEIAKKKAEDLLLIREKLMLTITHDIKAPLGSIMGYTDLLDRLTTEERQKFYLANMKGSSQHLLKLVNDLLDFHRLESNKMEVNRVAFNPRQLFNEIKTSFEPVAAKKSLELTYEIDESLDGNYISDPFRIRQIVDNLMSNALKFTQKGSVGLKVFYKDSVLTLAVTDTGSGISAEEKENIFQEFTRLRSAQGEEGFGLGLSITQKLVLLLEGDIQIDSLPGRGSTFIVHLPLYPIGGMAEHSSVQAEEKEETEMPEKGVNLLLIDDDRIQLNLTSAMLKQLGVNCVCCEHPEELFEYLKNETFDLILTDVQMPGLNGFELLHKLRNSGIPQAEKILVIAVTARSDMDEQSFIDKGFAGCLHKPFSLAELAEVIKRVVETFFPKEEIEEDIVTEVVEEGLNFSALTAFSEDDSNAAKEIIQTFISETEKNKERLREALDKHNAEGVAAMAHKLLPLLRLINATQCIAPLIWLEKQREQEFTEEMKEKAEFVLVKVNEVINEAESFVKRY